MHVCHMVLYVCHMILYVFRMVLYVCHMVCCLSLELYVCDAFFYCHIITLPLIVMLMISATSLPPEYVFEIC